VVLLSLLVPPLLVRRLVLRVSDMNLTVFIVTALQEEEEETYEIDDTPEERGYKWGGVSARSDGYECA